MRTSRKPVRVFLSCQFRSERLVGMWHMLLKRNKAEHSKDLSSFQCVYPVILSFVAVSGSFEVSPFSNIFARFEWILHHFAAIDSFAPTSATKPVTKVWKWKFLYMGSYFATLLYFTLESYHYSTYWDFPRLVKIQLCFGMNECTPTSILT